MGLSVVLFIFFFFRKLHVLSKNDEYKQNKPWFLLYVLGVPIFLTFSAILIDMTNVVPEQYKPNLGGKTCFVSADPIPKIIYFIGVEWYEFGLNLIFCILTALNLKAAQKEKSKVIKSSNKFG